MAIESYANSFLGIVCSSEGIRNRVRDEGDDQHEDDEQNEEVEVETHDEDDDGNKIEQEPEENDVDQELKGTEMKKTWKSLMEKTTQKIQHLKWRVADVGGN